ncbi:hypothetical protein ACFW3D_37510 [Streptomyces sp. NPDC058864]
MTANFSLLPWPSDRAPVAAQQSAVPTARPAQPSDAPTERTQPEVLAAVPAAVLDRAASLRTPTMCGLEAQNDLGMSHPGPRMPWWW